MSHEASTHAEAGSASAGQTASARSGAGAAGALREQVLDALSAVYDPELDEPITSLRFITSCDVSADGDVEVLLRLPTPQCAPNFAFLMASDTRRVARAVPGVRNVAVTLEDHYTGDEINAAMNGGQGFTGAFPGETDDDDLEALRELFTRKALIARQATVCQAMLAGGATAEEVTGATVAQLPDSARGAPRPGAATAAEDPDDARVAGVRAAQRRPGDRRPAQPLAADGPVGPDQPRGQRRHLPLTTASSPQPGDRT